MASDVKFIRKNGRVIPIHTGPGATSKNMQTAKEVGARAGTGIRKQAIAHANDAFNNKLTPAQQGTVKSAFKTGAAMFAGGAATITGLRAGQLGLKAADAAIGSYAKKASDARKDYRNAAIITSGLSIFHTVGTAATHVAKSRAEVSLPLVKKAAIEAPTFVGRLQASTRRG